MTERKRKIDTHEADVVDLKTICSLLDTQRLSPDDRQRLEDIALANGVHAVLSIPSRVLCDTLLKRMKQVKKPQHSRTLMDVERSINRRYVTPQTRQPSPIQEGPTLPTRPTLPTLPRDVLYEIWRRYFERQFSKYQVAMEMGKLGTLSKTHNEIQKKVIAGLEPLPVFLPLPTSPLISDARHGSWPGCPDYGYNLLRRCRLADHSWPVVRISDIRGWMMQLSSGDSGHENIVWDCPCVVIRFMISSRLGLFTMIPCMAPARRMSYDPRVMVKGTYFTDSDLIDAVMGYYVTPYTESQLEDIRRALETMALEKGKGYTAERLADYAFPSSDVFEKGGSRLLKGLLDKTDGIPKMFKGFNQVADESGQRYLDIRYIGDLE